VSSLPILPGVRPVQTTDPRTTRRLSLLVAASLGIHAGVLTMLARPVHPDAPAQSSGWAVTLEFVPEASPQPAVVPDEGPAEPASAEPAVTTDAPPPATPATPATPAQPPTPAIADTQAASPPRQPPPPRRADSPPRSSDRPSADRRPPPRPAESGSAPAALARASPPGMDLPLTPPRPVAGMAGNRPPVYPERARQRGEQGRVVLRVDVSVDGMPITVSVAQSSGHPVLDEAAIAAVRQWRFVAATRGGTAVPAAADVPVRFTLAE
jgi:protein TonB